MEEEVGAAMRAVVEEAVVAVVAVVAKEAEASKDSLTMMVISSTILSNKVSSIRSISNIKISSETQSKRFLRTSKKERSASFSRISNRNRHGLSRSKLRSGRRGRTVP